MDTNCSPLDTRRSCAFTLICERCHRCLLHCTCPPSEQRASEPGVIEYRLRQEFFTRRVPNGRLNATTR